MDEDELYRGLVTLCQQYGYTTEHTYDLLQQVVQSIQTEPEED